MRHLTSLGAKPLEPLTTREARIAASDRHNSIFERLIAQLDTLPKHLLGTPDVQGNPQLGVSVRQLEQWVWEFKHQIADETMTDPSAEGAAEENRAAQSVVDAARAEARAAEAMPGE